MESVRITKEQGEFFKIKSVSTNGKVFVNKYGANYIKDLCCIEEPEIKPSLYGKHKKVNIKVK